MFLSFQIEPYFTTLALFDAKEGRKLTEDFHFNINSDDAMEMLKQVDSQENGEVASSQQPPEWSNIPSGYLTKIKRVGICPCMLRLRLTGWLLQAVFSVSQPHSDVFLVLRVEKVLQGAIGPCTEPYFRGGKDPKLALRVHKAAKTCCQR